MPGVFCVHQAPGPAPAHRAPRPPVLDVAIPAGRHSLRIRVREPAGVIAFYRISVQRGAVVRASVMIPGTTVPLALRAPGRAPWERCWNAGVSTVCGASEEGCPMPPAVWRLTLDKLAGPPGRVRVWFRVADGVAS